MNMSRTLTPLLCLAVTGLVAQPSIQQISMHAGDAVVIDPDFPITEAGPGGANAVWDFSGSSFSGLEMVHTAMLPTSTPYAANYPDATMALHAEWFDGYEIEIYAYMSFDGGYTDHGEFLLFDGDEYPGVYTDPLLFFTLPLTTTSSGEDTYISVDEYVGGSTITATGNHSWTVDGYGTLILPNATYTDVLRIHAVQQEDLSIDIGGATIPSEASREEWWWVKADIPFPLLIFSLETEDGETEPGSKAALISFTGAVGIIDLERQQPLRVHPNPARDVLHLGLQEQGPVSYRVLDALGREVLQGSTTGGHTIDTANLQAGAYLVEIHGTKGLRAARFIKE